MHRCLVPLLLCALLLSGCSGGLAPVVPPVVEPEEPYAPEYDGSLTQLIVELQRNEITPEAALFGIRSESQSQDTAYIHIEKRDPDNHIVYQTSRKVALPTGQLEVEFPFEIPSDQGYEVKAHTYRDTMLLGISAPTPVSAPAKTLTTATVPVVPPTYELIKPDVLYSGGDLQQFDVRVIPYGSWVNYKVLFAWNPWTTNPNYWYPGDELYQLNSGFQSSEYLPTVTQPQKLYYQVILQKSSHPDGEWHYAFRYFPDLTTETELPFIWVYPDPSWTQ